MPDQKPYELPDNWSPRETDALLTAPGTEVSASATTEGMTSTDVGLMRAIDEAMYETGTAGGFSPKDKISLVARRTGRAVIARLPGSGPAEPLASERDEMQDRHACRRLLATVERDLGANSFEQLKLITTNVIRGVHGSIESEDIQATLKRSNSTADKTKLGMLRLQVNAVDNNTTHRDTVYVVDEVTRKSEKSESPGEWHHRTKYYDLHPHGVISVHDELDALATATVQPGEEGYSEIIEQFSAVVEASKLNDRLTRESFN